MEVSKQTTRRLRRRLCEHCDKELSHTQYLKHKKCFFKNGVWERKSKMGMSRDHRGGGGGSFGQSMFTCLEDNSSSDEQMIRAFSDPSNSHTVQEEDTVTSCLRELSHQFTQLTASVNQQLGEVNRKLLSMEERMAALEAKVNCDSSVETITGRAHRVEVGFRSSLCKAMVGPLLDPTLFRLDEIYRDFSPEDRPLITTIGIRPDAPLVECEFGMVQKGSVLSYHRPLFPSGQVNLIPHAPPMPVLPLDGHHLEPPSCAFVCSAEELFHLKSMEISLYAAHKLEEATRKQSSPVEQCLFKKPRLSAARFGMVCLSRGQSKLEDFAKETVRSALHMTHSKRSKMESGADAEYCRLMNVNYTSCGLVIHPDAPWLYALPDGIIFDPTEHPQFGLTVMKCLSAKSHVECTYLEVDSGLVQLKKTHQYYWQVQGQLLITGMQWCDFVVFAQDDFFVQRIYVDAAVQREMREKIDYFYFYVYMPKYLELSCLEKEQS
ncbi:hypothetical protein ACEWY4_005627 [Coilia grayii]|uniref:YqaJ viral recombinase domain-containing protein n=1 Tax=Coilia grayii TaxID=363190 RepID=A0ABD1KJ44_9TELE